MRDSDVVSRELVRTAQKSKLGELVGITKSIDESRHIISLYYIDDDEEIVSLMIELSPVSDGFGIYKVYHQDSRKDTEMKLNSTEQERKDTILELHGEEIRIIYSDEERFISESELVSHNI